MADNGDTKEKPVESRKPEEKAAPIDNSALSDKPRAAGSQDIDMLVLDGVKRKENTVRENTGVQPLFIDGKNAESQDGKTKARDESRSDEHTGYRGALKEGANIFFDRSKTETERLIAVRDSYDRIASILPKSEAKPIIKQGRELLAINAADGMRETLSKFGLQNTTEKDNQDLIKRLTELNRLAQAEPPGDTAKFLVDKLAGPKNVDELIRKLSASDSVTQLQAVKELLAALKTGPDFLKENLLSEKVNEARNAHLSKTETVDIMSAILREASGDKNRKVEKIQSREPGADRAVQVIDRNGEISQYHFKGRELIAIKEGGRPLPTGSGIEFATQLRKPALSSGINDNWMVVQAPGRKTGDVFRQSISLDESTGKVTRKLEPGGEKLITTGGAIQESADGQSLKIKLASGVWLEARAGQKEPTAIIYPDGTRVEALGEGKFKELKLNSFTGKLEEQRSFTGAWSMHGDKAQLVAKENGRTEIFRTDSRVAIGENGQEVTITQANGKQIRVGGLDGSGNPNKIYSGKNDGSYSATQDGKLWHSYDKEGKLLPGEPRQERVLLDVDKGSLSFIKLDGSGALKKSFDGGEKEYKSKADGTPTGITEKRPDGTLIKIDFENGKRTATREERPDGSMRHWQHLVHSNPNLDGMTLLLQRRTAKENGSKDLTLTYALSDKADGLPFVSSYSDQSGKWQFKRNASGSAEYFVNEATGEARAEKVFMGQDGRMEKLAMVQSDVIGLSNEDQKIKEEIGMDGVTLGTVDSGNIIRNTAGLVARTVSSTGQTTDFEYNVTGYPMKVTETQNGQVKIWEANNAALSCMWRSSAGERQSGGWRISKNTGEQFFIFDEGNSYRKSADADKFALVDDGATAQARVKGLFDAYDDYYLTNHRRAEAMKRCLEVMTPDEVLKFRREYAAKYKDDYPTFGHYVDWKFGESTEGKTLTDMINPRARTYTELDAERSAINLRSKLNELGESGWFKRSDAQISADMRKAVADMSQKELSEMNRLYKARYFKSALDDVESRPQHASTEEVHKEAMQLYLTTGTDKRTAEQEKHLIDQSLKAGGQFVTVSLGDPESADSARLQNQEISKAKLELFKEFSARASKDARTLFLKDDGDKKLEAGLVPAESRHPERNYKFENSIFAGSGDAGRIMTIARDYARDGKSSVTTKIEEENWGSGPSQERLNQIFAGMDSDERAKFRLGFELTSELKKPESQGKTQALLSANSPEGERAREAVDYYKDLSEKCHGLHWFNKDIKEARYLQAAYGAGLGSELDKHAGFFTNADAQKFMKSVEDMDSASYRNLLTSPNLREMLYKQIDDRFGADKDAKRAEQLLKDKLAFSDRLLAQKGGPTEAELLAYNPTWKEKPDLFKTFLAGKNEASSLASKTPAEREKRLNELAGTTEGKATLKTLDYFYAKAHELASSQVRRDLLLVVKDNTGRDKTALGNILDGALKMSDGERHKYATDANYRKEIDTELNKHFQSTHGRNPAIDRQVEYGREAVQAVLKQIESGEQPKKNAIVSLFERAAQGPSLSEGIKILNSTLSTPEGAELRARLSKDANFDPLLKADFDRAVKSVFQSAYNGKIKQELADLDKRIIEPVIATGIVPGKEMARYLGARAIVESLTNMTDEKGALSKLDKNQKETLIADLKNSLSPEQSKLVSNIVSQGRALPEDKLRGFVLNPGSDEALWSQLGSLNLNDQAFRHKLSQDYSTKYRGDLVSDLVSKAAFKDSVRIEAALHPDAWSQARSLEHARQFIGKVDDYGKDWTWDSTRLQMEESLNRFSQAKREADKDHQKLSETEIAEHQRRVYSDAGAHICSQEARADAFADTVILASAAAATVMTGGAASPMLIAAFTAGGAGLKFGTAACMTDGKMDMRTGNVLAKLGSGAVNGFTGVFGPGEIAACLKLGSGAATRATGEVLSHEAFAGLSATAKAQLQETLSKNLAQSLEQQIVSGITKSEAELIRGALNQTAAKGLLSTEQTLIAEQILKESLAKSVAAEGKAMLVTKSLALSQASGVSGSVLGTATQMGLAGQDMSFEDLRDSIVRGSLGAFGGHLAGMSTALAGKPGSQAGFLRSTVEKAAAPVTLIAGMTGANFTAENLVAAMRGEGYSGEGLNRQVLNAAWAPFFQHLRASVESHAQAARPSLRESLHQQGEEPANQKSTGHAVLHKLPADHVATKLAELENTLTLQRASLPAETIAAREREIHNTKELLKANLVKDAGEMLGTTLGIEKEKAAEMAARLLELHTHEGGDINGFFSPQEGNVNLFVGSKLYGEARPGQINLHEFAHLADAARYQALYDANPKLFVETLVNDCLSGSFSKGRARLETSLFGEDTFERKAAAQHNFSKEDVNFARSQLRDYLVQNARDGQLPAVPEASELHKWILKRGAEFPNHDYAHNQKLLYEMRREISNARVTFANTRFSDEALAKPAVQELVAATRANMGSLNDKAPYERLLSGISDATMALSEKGHDYYFYGSRHENSANRIQYSRALQAAITDYPELLSKFQSALSTSAQNDTSGQAARFMQTLAIKDSSELTAKLFTGPGERAIYDLATNKDAPIELREAAARLGTNTESALEAHKALNHLTALDMLQRDAARLRAAEADGSPAQKAELEDKVKHWAEQALSTIPQSEVGKLQAYLVRRGYLSEQEGGAHGAAQRSETVNGEQGEKVRSAQNSLHGSAFKRPADTSSKETQASKSRNGAGQDAGQIEVERQKRLFEHDGRNLKLDEDEVKLMQEAFKDGSLKYVELDREFLRSHEMKAREEKPRPSSQASLPENTSTYDPFKTSQPIIVVYEPESGEYHVINGNNRIMFFGSEVKNPQNKAVPVMLFTSPEAMEKTMGHNPRRLNGRMEGYEFNFEDKRWKK